MNKIAKVETQILEDRHLPQLLVRVTMEDGLSGLGECWWGVSPADPQIEDLNLPSANMVDPIASTVNKILSPVVVGENADRLEGLWQKMLRFAYRYGDEGILRCAVSGIDMALWDLLGKRLAVPVVQLMGGAVRNSIRAYASLPPLRDARRLKQETRRALDFGFSGIKLHEYEPQMAGLVREEAGEDVAIMFDVNGHFSPAESIKVAEELLEYDVCWFEEPTWPMRDHEAMLCVKQQTGICIAAGENEYNLDSFERLMKSGAVDYVMPEISKIGGLTAAKKLSAMGEMFNMPLSPHGFRIGPAFYANLHWALCCPTADWLEIPFLPQGFEFPAKLPLPPMENGKISLPRGVGLGIPKKIEEHFV